MFPFEFTLEGPPLSLQTRNRQNLQLWKARVSSAAQDELQAGIQPTVDNVSVTITYYYEESSPDVDNIIKPIQDALIGIIFVDDDQVVDTKSRKRQIDSSFRIRGSSAKVLAAFAQGNNFVHIKIEEEPNMEVLD